MTASPPPAGPSGSPQSTSRATWIALVLLTAVIIGGIAGLLGYAGGSPIPTAILTGGGGFAGTVLLLLALIHYAGH